MEDAGIKAIAAGCPHLEELHIPGCNGVTGEAVKAIAKVGVQISQFPHVLLFCVYMCLSVCMCMQCIQILYTYTLYAWVRLEERVCLLGFVVCVRWREK